MRAGKISPTAREEEKTGAGGKYGVGAFRSLGVGWD